MAKPLKFMKSLLFSFKLFLFRIFSVSAFIASFYLSIIFFLVLLANETLKRERNEALRGEFFTIISRLSALPEKLFDAEERKEVDLSKGLF